MGVLVTVRAHICEIDGRVLRVAAGGACLAILIRRRVGRWSRSYALGVGQCLCLCAARSGLWHHDAVKIIMLLLDSLVVCGPELFVADAAAQFIRERCLCPCVARTSSWLRNAAKTIIMPLNSFRPCLSLYVAQRLVATVSS